MSSCLLEIRDLRKSFQTDMARIDVLNGINLNVMKGDTIALVGASGAGKSTLLHIMGTLDKPSSGNVFFQGEDVFTLNERALATFRNRSIGFVFQFHHLLPEFTALENVMMPALISGISKDVARESALVFLEDVGLSHRVKHKPGELSGGEQQRVAIARALVLSPALLLADEPTGNLDRKTSEEVHELLAGIQRKTGLTLIIVTHNERLAARMGKTIHMVDGRIQENGNP
ncbi:MAG: ABC transporter ATP-binding protein [Deltaproteobacteria bacterium]|nr:ABC transporter ATP-binding protein [Deltaproteobacteria bacterium]TLN03507.1 MAG: ABC transporter ATP-binding protein [bacterium]